MDSVDKMAGVLDMDRSTIYRYLKQLEDLRLIKTLRTREKTIYVVLPVPPAPPEAGSTPLFDAVEFKTPDQTSIWPVCRTDANKSSTMRLILTDATEESHLCHKNSHPRDQSVALTRIAIRKNKTY